MSERHACQLTGWSRSSLRYRHGIDLPRLRTRIRALAAQDPQAGYRRLTARLRKDGWEVNHKRVYRLLKEMGLARRRERVDTEGESAPGAA